MDRFEDLRAFVAVVEAGSFTAAAERLNGDKSAISRRISALEDRLGVQLIRRTTRRLSLTDTGRSFYRRSAQILADLDEAESSVAQQHGELRGRLRVALPLSFGIRHMGAPIAEFNRRHPAVNFDLELSDRRVDLLQEDVDLALRIGHLPDSALIARRLFSSRLIVCASPAYLQQYGEPASPDELLRHHCLTYSNLPDSDYWSWLDENGLMQRVKINVAMSANSGDLLCKAAAGGLGIVMQPAFIAHDAISDGELVPILSKFARPTADAYVIYPPTRHLSYRVRAFIDYLVEYFAGTPYWDDEC